MITKNMTITEVIQKQPKSVELLLESGLHCLGCMAAQFESLEEGFLAHGKSEEEIDDIVKKINKLGD